MPVVILEDFFGCVAEWTIKDETKAQKFANELILYLTHPANHWKIYITAAPTDFFEDDGSSVQLLD